PTAPIIEDWVSDTEDESETTVPQIALSFVQTSEHVKPSGHSIQPAQPTPRNYVHRGTHKQNASFTRHHSQMHMVPGAVLTQSKPISITAVRPICAAMPKIMVTRPRHAHSIDTKPKSTFRRHITCGQSPKTSNSPPKVTAARAPVVSAAKESNSESLSPSSHSDRIQPSGKYHGVPPPITRNFMPPKPDLVFHTAPIAVEMLTQSKPVYILVVRPIYADVPKIIVTRPRHAHSIDTKSKSTFRRHMTRGQSLKTSNTPPRVTATQAPVVSAAKGRKGK
nr:hypothetical protein [Tanacetum cinerariifolium]